MYNHPNHVDDHVLTFVSWDLESRSYVKLVHFGKKISMFMIYGLIVDASILT